MARKGRTFGPDDRPEGNESPGDETPADETPADEASADEITADETPEEPEEVDAKEILDEASALAGKVGDALNTLWESPERKGLEVNAKRAAKDVQKGVLQGLKFLNRQMDGRRRDWREDRSAAREADDEVDDLEK